MAKKYIDAELLRKEIKRRITDNTFGAKLELIDILAWLDSLQQEQPSEKTCKSCGFYENNCPYIRGKFIPYPSKVCKDYTYSVIKEQEQPSEDLKKEIQRYLREECSSDDEPSIGEIARHFANWQKGQMLKDAVEASVNYYENIPGGSYVELVADILNPTGVRYKDKVKIVIVKED